MLAPNDIMCKNPEGGHAPSLPIPMAMFKNLSKKIVYSGRKLLLASCEVPMETNYNSSVLESALF